MTPFRRMSPRRPAIGRAALSLCLAAATWLPAAAQDADAALRAADPDSPVTGASPLVLPPIRTAELPAPPADMDTARAVWRDAHARVAEFPRGHADLLRWESRQPPTHEASATTTAVSQDRLGLDEAVARSLRWRPELFIHADMNALARARVRAAYAGHVREVQQAWIEAVAAQQSWHLQNGMRDAARTGTELGERMWATGNWSQARQAAERLAEAQAWQASVKAQARALVAQERLARLLGVWTAEAVRQMAASLPETLPGLPPLEPGDARGLEAQALHALPGLAQDRQQLQRLQAGSAAPRQRNWDAAVEAAIGARPDALQTANPPQINDLQLLRDAALAQTIQARAGVLRQAVERRSRVREAWLRVQATHALASHAQDVVARLQAGLEQETLLRYNGMLQSTWDLLASARERMRALDDATQARAEAWQARADLQALLAGAE
ncbi:hypothetical protein [Hydrogenophaga sp.]|uniref:hypothetical protein n=1 Tax=Hydrogenophaga sp. TaxID=1904254 RepID=UPI002619C5B4|nr:hypothetical protein [Hydrogenophaga sp.]MCW5653459.1 hypothetical protein [Hydrogenophaga sp.]